MNGAVRCFDRDPLGQLEQAPQVADPRAYGNDHRLDADRPTIGFHCRDRSTVQLEAGDPGPREDPYALGSCLVGQRADGGPVVGVSAALLVQHAGYPLRLPVGEDALHVAGAVGLTLHEDGRVPDVLLLAIDLRHAVVHDLG
jgi:hypothetical protein